MGCLDHRDVVFQGTLLRMGLNGIRKEPQPFISFFFFAGSDFFETHPYGQPETLHLKRLSRDVTRPGSL